MATFACLNPLTGERLAVVLGMSAPNEVSHAQAPFAYGFAGKPQKDAQTYMQHLALRTTDIEKLKSYLESKGAEFLTPIYKDKDSFGPLLQSFTRELFDDEWFFIEFVQRDYDADKVGPGGTQFVQNTVKSLYVSKQEEFREWEKTGKKRKFLDGVPLKDRTNLLQDIFANTGSNTSNLGTAASWCPITPSSVRYRSDRRRGASHGATRTCVPRAISKPRIIPSTGPSPCRRSTTNLARDRTDLIASAI